MSRQKERTTITLTKQANQMRKQHIDNLSQLIEEEIRKRCDPVNTLRKQREQKEQRKREIVETISDLRREKNELEDELRRLDQLITKSDLVDAMENDRTVHKKVTEKLHYVRRAPDGEQTEIAIEKNAAVLAEEDGLSFDEDELADALRLMAGL